MDPALTPREDKTMATKTEVEFDKGQATPEAVIAALASAPDGVQIKVMAYLNGDLRKLSWSTP